MFEATAESAISYAQNNKPEEWLHTFLLGEGNNKGLSDVIKNNEKIIFHIKKMKLDFFKRCFEPGIENDNTVREDNGQFFWNKVNEIANRFKTGDWDMPPLVALERNKTFYEIDDGSHRFEALKMLGIDEYRIILWGSNE